MKVLGLLSVSLEKYKGLVSMKLCSECGTWYPDFDIAGQENDRCPACGIPLQSNEYYNDINILGGVLGPSKDQREDTVGDSYVKIKISNRKVQLNLPYVEDYTDGYAAMAACIINALVAIDMQKTLDYIAYNWEPTDA